jgi:integrase
MLLARIDRPTPRRLAKSWPKGTTRVARMMFADAHRDGLIAANPFTQLRLETPKARKDLDALTEEQIGTLAAAAIPAMGEYGPQFRAVVLFLADVGCRPGELCCIRRADVDRERRGHDPLHARWPRGREASEERPPSRRDHPATGTPGARRRAWTARTCFTPRQAVGCPRPPCPMRSRRQAALAQRERVELYELRYACATLLM